MTRTRQILLFLGACGLFACGGDDDGIVIADSGPTVDSGPDANLGCGDYEEASDATNNELALAGLAGTAETSGISLASGDTKVICGVIDPANAEDTIGALDVDAFDIDVSEGAAVRAVLRTDGADQTGGVLLFLQYIDPDDNPHTWGAGGFADGYALATSGQEVAGTWRLVPLAFAGETAPTAAIDYQIEITERPACDAAAGEADYTEAKDGAKNRKNDAVGVVWDNDPSFKLTRSTTDLPEPTGLTLDVDTPVHVHGVSADLTANDDYHDKDTYAMAIGEGVNELDIRVTWADGTDADLDALAFIAGMPEQELTAGNVAFGSTTPDDIGTARVPAGADMWLWIGTYKGATDLPQDYDVTICPRTFTP
jgi:hypothetical protein